MKLKGIPGLIWALGGLVLGAVGGFWMGRQGMVGPEGGEKGARAVRVQGAGETGRADLKKAAQAGQGGMEKAGVPLGDSPQQTLRNILAIADPVARMVAMRAWSGTLRPEEVQGVLKEFEAMMEAQEQVGSMETMAMFLQSLEVITLAMFERGPAEMVTFFLAEGEDGKTDEMKAGLGVEIYHRWVESDPAGARSMLEARLAGGKEPGEAEKEMSRHLMCSWIRKEPDAAMTWLLKQAPELADGVASRALQSLSHVDPAKARELLVAQADRPGRAEMASVMAEWWAKSDPAKAMEWALGLPEQLSGDTVKGTLKTWAAKDFPAARLAVEGMSGVVREAGLPALVEHWPPNSEKDAAAFLEQQPEGTGKQEATRQLITNWANGDQQAASAWLAGQAAGPARDAGAAALAEEVRRSDPEAAAVWGATLTEPAARQESLKATFQEWTKQSVPAALKWVETAPGLTEADRAALLGTAPER